MMTGDNIDFALIEDITTDAKFFKFFQNIDSFSWFIFPVSLFYIIRISGEIIQSLENAASIEYLSRIFIFIIINIFLYISFNVYTRSNKTIYLSISRHISVACLIFSVFFPLSTIFKSAGNYEVLDSAIKISFYIILSIPTVVILRILNSDIRHISSLDKRKREYLNELFEGGILGERGDLFNEGFKSNLHRILGLGEQKSSGLRAQAAIVLVCIAHTCTLTLLCMIYYNPVNLAGFVIASGTKFHDTLLLMAFFISLLVFGNFLRIISRRLYQLNYERISTKDLRSPILYLRSFRGDSVPLEADWKERLFNLIDIRFRPRKIESIVHAELSKYGPLVAIGKPGEKLPPLGAARKYIKNEDWKNVVQDLTENSKLVAISVDDTEGVLWELKNVRSSKLSGNLILLFPPITHDEKNLEKVIIVSSEAFGVRRITLKKGENPIAMFEDDGLIFLYVSSEASANVYQFAIRKISHQKRHATKYR